MRKNLGSLDRSLRFLIAMLILLAINQDWITDSLAITGFVISLGLFITSFVGICPLYAPFGLRTCEKEEVSMES